MNQEIHKQRAVRLESTKPLVTTDREATFSERGQPQNVEVFQSEHGSSSHNGCTKSHTVYR